MMRTKHIPLLRPRAQQRGIMLLEALIAVVILAIGLVGTIGLQARAQAALMQADMRAEATMASEKLVSIMSVDQGDKQDNLKNYVKTLSATPPAPMAEWHQQLIKRIPSAKVAVGVKPDSAAGVQQVDVVITFQRRKDDAVGEFKSTSYVSIAEEEAP